MTHPKPITLKDLAEELNLSVSTVSRALSGTGRMSDATRDRVLRAVKQANYTPNAVARSLRMQNVMSIGIIVTDITNSFFSSVIKGAQAVSRQEGYSVLLSDSDENEAFEKEALQLMLEKQVNGLVLASTGQNAKKIDLFRQQQVPIVFIDNVPMRLSDFDSVTTNNYQAAYTLTGMLIQKGYRQIGMITGPLAQSSALHRYHGFTAAMQEHGVSINREWIRHGDFRLSGGQAAMADILCLDAAERPRAMVISNNFMTYGAVRAIRDRGLSIPGDIAVASFDTSDMTSLATLSIASMNQNPEEIGARAVALIISRMQSASAPSCVNIVLDPVFVDGNSW
jgi:DNA-binding LacI/PurR family transcriptional regulator